MRMEEPEIIVSRYSRTYEEDGLSLEICIYRLVGAEWTLEIVSEDGCSTVWDDPFGSDEEALFIALKAIEEDGVESFSNEGGDVPTVH
ncbi:hypothetical protein [Roseibium algae]|uniref:Uncharacterized protein n=1 Tax=Roseibium algae TaxID=3123038 RepID=A0ABU8TEK3_9HYPH